MEVVCDEFGINPCDYLDYLASGLRAEMASQPELGLWAKRRTRFGSGDHSDSSLVGAHLAERPLRLEHGRFRSEIARDGSGRSLEYKL
jgi:hypothetical protein